MKYIYLIALILFSFNAKSQENVHWLINKDSITDCSFIKSGKFVNEEIGGKITKGYSIEFRGENVIEKIENGKYYLRSKINYTSECSYEIKVLESNIPGYEVIIGQTFYTEILETAKIDKLIKIRSKDEQWKTFVFRKVEE
ncbi:hypothetical protein FLAN108750_08650 [Flavobacterium antarcticum]|uniref:hypothetical protein n=1 Tax=Flavobacterium antarcticum TaxID=271155 RepID=UPI0003B640A0|nr:hypothetical protein [Flavobacterium antarcticum]